MLFCFDHLILRGNNSNCFDCTRKTHTGSLFQSNRTWTILVEGLLILLAFYTEWLVSIIQDKCQYVLVCCIIESKPLNCDASTVD